MYSPMGKGMQVCLPHVTRFAPHYGGRCYRRIEIGASDLVRHSLRRRMFFKSGTLFLVALTWWVLTACVPSPTATPPRQTPFPTLPLTQNTPTLAPNETASVVATAAPTNAPGTAPATRVPTARASTADASLLADTMPPLVQITVQDPELPVSTDQVVALNVLAADNDLVTRLDVYDNNVLFAQMNAPEPSAVLSNQFRWQVHAPGKHTLRAVAFDVSGNASVPAQIELTVINNNRAPTVIITFPSGSKDAELGAPLTIQGVATDDVAVTRMDLIVDNQLVTFVTPEKPVTPFAVAIPWTPLTTGAHNIVLRAYDNRGQSDDSLRYTVRVFDNQPPVVTANVERTTIPSGDVLLVEALALSSNGVARVELYVDEQLAAAATSQAAPQQTAMSATLAANELADGTHTMFVRAVDLTGHTTDTERVIFTVAPGAPRIARTTPTAQPKATALPPTATPTAPLILPPAPTVQVELVGDPLRVFLPEPAQIKIQAHGSVELDRIELWARYPGESVAQLLAEESGKGATDKTLTFDWHAVRAGTAEVYARVTDNLGQVGRSAILRVTLEAPPPQAPEPPGLNFSGAWFAESPALRFDATFTQFGRALRGILTVKRADGKTMTGKIVSGAVGDKNLFFAVDFARDATASPDAAASPDAQATLLFDCTFQERPAQMTCNYTTENGERGSALFRPLGQ